MKELRVSTPLQVSISSTGSIHEGIERQCFANFNIV